METHQNVSRTARFLRGITENGMIRSIFTVLSGSLVAQIIALAALPFFSRLYDAEAFGKYQIYFSSLIRRWLRSGRKTFRSSRK